MSKEIKDVICQFCETEYKLSFDPQESSGSPKFCPFCGEIHSEEEEEAEDT